MKQKKIDSKHKKRKKKVASAWVIHIFFITFALAILMSIVSESLIRSVTLVLANVLLFTVVLIGVLSDTIGIAVTAAEEKYFHAMAAKKRVEANYAIYLVKNAGPVANFCNDVIGDIAGIISGTIVAAIVFKTAVTNFNFNAATLSILLSALVASLTVGGKALGKEYAIKNSTVIVMRVSKIICKVDKYLGKRIIRTLKNKRRKA